LIPVPGTAGESLETAGESLVSAGESLVSAGERLVSAGDSLVSAGDTLVSAGDNLETAGDNLVSAGDSLETADRACRVAKAVSASSGEVYDTVSGNFEAVLAVKEFAVSKFVLNCILSYYFDFRLQRYGLFI
jgi:hypothetical protein